MDFKYNIIFLLVIVCLESAHGGKLLKKMTKELKKILGGSKFEDFVQDNLVHVSNIKADITNIQANISANVAEIKSNSENIATNAANISNIDDLFAGYSCPDSGAFHLIQGKCYAFQNVALDFESAKSRCMGIFPGGKVFAPKDKQTHDTVIELVKSYASNPVVWFGFNWDKSNNKLTYISDGQTVTMTALWATNYPKTSLYSSVVTRPSHKKWYNDRDPTNASGSFTVCECNVNINITSMQANIAANSGSILANNAIIDTNTNQIATNTANIASHDTGIATNAASIMRCNICSVCCNLVCVGINYGIIC
jgi:hypothetical protein